MFTRRSMFATLAASLGVVVATTAAEAATKSVVKKKRPVRTARATTRASAKKVPARS